MGREGWLYVLAFVAILGAGAFLIVPRLSRLSADADADTTEPPPPVGPDAGSGTAGAGATAAPPPPPAWVRVRVEGPRGLLKGPLKDVVGAEVEHLGDPEDPVAHLRLRPNEAVIHVGASGHLWRALDADALSDGDVVVLPVAAPSVVLRVREDDGTPAPGVPVLVQPERPGPVSRTDRGGTVILDDLPPGLVVTQVGGRERRGPTLRLVAGRDRDRTAVLEPAWEIRGRAVDARGQPRAGVRVLGLTADGALGRPTVSDERGRFVWRGPVTSTAALRLTLPGHALAHAEAVPPGRGPLVSELGDVVLRQAVASLEGRVLAASRVAAPPRVRVEPAVSAILREVFGSRAALDAPFETTCDPDGSFRVPDVPSAIPLRVSIRGGGLQVDDLVTPIEGPVRLEAYTPPPGHVLEGHVVDAVEDRPAVGLRLLLSTQPVDGPTPRPGDREVVTDGAGRFRVGSLPRGAVFVRAYLPGRRAILHEATVPRTTPLRLELSAPSSEAEHVLAGVVVDELNAPLAGVTVRAAGRATVTEADGTFRLTDVVGTSDSVPVTAGYEPGQVSAKDPVPFVTGVRRLASPGPDALKLVLTRGASLSFRAIDGLDDVPLAFVHALLRSEDGQILLDRAVALTDGVARFDGLLPMGGTLSLFSDRHRVTISVMLEAGKTVDLGTLRLARGMHITGRVVDVDDQPVPGARLGGVEEGWLARRGSNPTVERELELRRTVADDDGNFVFDGFDPKVPAVLAAWAPGYAPAARRVVLEKFQDDVHLEVTIRLQRGGWFAVELLEEGTGEPISGAMLDLEDARNGSDYLDLLRRGTFGGPVGSDEDWRLASAHLLFEKSEGRYRLGPVEPGPYEVLVDRRGYRVLRRRLTVIDPADALVGVAGSTTRSLIDSPYLTWELTPD